MASLDVFKKQDNYPKKFTGKISYINKHLEDKLNIQELDNNKYSRIKVAIIDTGMNSDLINHFDGKRPSSVQNRDYNGHGSHVAGILYSLSPFIQIKSKKYHNNKSYIDSLRSFVYSDIQIINFSGNGSERIEAEKYLISKAQQKGKILIVAAGNDSLDLDKIENKSYPASYHFENVISVANINKYSILQNDSNYGKSVTIGVDGSEIKSLDFNNSIKELSGTSQSTPIISSAIAKIKSKYPTINIKQIKYILKENSKPSVLTELGIFRYNSFIRWMNQNYKLKNIQEYNGTSI